MATTDETDLSPVPTLASRIARGTAWNLAGTVGSRIFTVTAMILCARILGKEAFGQLGMVRSTIGMFGVLGGLSLGVTATKFVAEFRTTNPQKAGDILSMALAVGIVASLLTGTVVVTLCDGLAEYTLNAPALALELRLAVLLLVAAALDGLVRGALAGFEAFQATAMVAGVQGILTLPAVSLLSWRYGLAGAVVGLSVGMYAGLLVGAACLSRECIRFCISLPWRGFWSNARVLWSFSLPATLRGVVIGPALWGASAILVNQPGGYGELGAFAATMQWKNLITYLPMAMLGVFLPVLSETHGRGDRGPFAEVLIANVYGVSIACTCLCVAIVCCAPYVLSLYGPEFQGHEVLLGVTVLGAMFHMLSAGLSQGLVSAGRMWLDFALIVVSCLTLLLSALLLAPKVGALGLALAYIASYSTHVLCELCALRNTAIVRAVLLLCAACVAFTLAAALLARWHAVLGLLAAVPLSTLAFAVSWTLSPSKMRGALIAAVEVHAPRIATWMCSLQQVRNSENQAKSRV